jgi:hypothetical protein
LLGQKTPEYWKKRQPKKTNTWVQFSNKSRQNCLLFCFDLFQHLVSNLLSDLTENHVEQSNNYRPSLLLRNIGLLNFWFIPSLAPSILRLEAHFGLRNTSAPIILRLDANFGTTHFGSKIKILKVLFCAFHRQGEIKAIIINNYITRSSNKLENLPCKGKQRQFNLYKQMFSIKAHFLIWSYQACNNSFKLVTCMAPNPECSLLVLIDFCPV